MRVYEEFTGYKCCVQGLIHRRLVGLNVDQLDLIWISADGHKQLQPGMYILEHRSMNLFLDPVSCLSAHASLDKSD